MVGFASSGDREYAVRRGGVTFYLVRANDTVDHELWEGFDLAVSRSERGAQAPA